MLSAAWLSNHRDEKLSAATAAGSLVGRAPIVVVRLNLRMVVLHGLPHLGEALQRSPIAAVKRDCPHFIAGVIYSGLRDKEVQFILCQYPPEYGIVPTRAERGVAAPMAAGASWATITNVDPTTQEGGDVGGKTVHSGLKQQQDRESVVMA